MGEGLRRGGAPTLRVCGPELGCACVSLEQSLLIYDA